MSELILALAVALPAGVLVGLAHCKIWTVMMRLLIGRRIDDRKSVKIAVVVTYTMCALGLAAMIVGIMFSGLFSLANPDDVANLAVFFLYLMGVAVGAWRFSERPPQTTSP